MGASGSDEQRESAEELTRRLLAPRPIRKPDLPASRSLGRRLPRRRWLALGVAVVFLVAVPLWLWWVNVAPSPSSSGKPPSGDRVAITPRSTVVALAASPGDRTSVSLPLLTLAELLQRPLSDQLRTARFKPNPLIVVIEYPTLREQGLAMNRLAAMLEKRAAHGDRVLTEAELDALMRRSGDNVATFYQGHDYPAAKVARFFSQAGAQRVALNTQESQLQSLLLEVGLIKRGIGGFQTVGEQAVISFTGVHDDPAAPPGERVDGVRREAILRHELSHGEFFVDPAYRAHCMKFWRHALNDQERKKFTAYFRSLDYNTDDEELMANEAQAFLMHTPDSRAFSASNLGLPESALADLRSRFRKGEPLHGLKD